MEEYGDRNKYFDELNFYAYACGYSLYYIILNFLNVCLKSY